jgi:hypothetical protein
MSLAEKFDTLFSGLRRAYGTYTIKEVKGKKRTGQGRTIKSDVTTELWERHLSGDQFLGIVPIRQNGTCVFGAIDVDDYDLDLLKLEQAIKKHKMPLVLCRSKSGGAHCYLFLKKPAAANKVRERLAHYSAVLGYGGVEIFPKQDRLINDDDTGNWINMPYFEGKDTVQYAIVDGQQLSAQDFIAHAISCAVLPDDLEAEPESPELLREAPPCLVTLAAGGFPDGSRNLGLFNLGVYCRKRWGEDYQDKLVEMNQLYMGDPLPDSEVKQVIKNIGKKEYSYRCREQPIAPVCQRHECLKKRFGIGMDAALDELGIEIKNPLRVNVDPVLYIAEVNGMRVEITSEDMVSQTRFRKTVIDQGAIYILTIPSKKFEIMMSDMAARAEIVETGTDTSHRAPIRDFLRVFCTMRAPARQIEEVIEDGAWKNGTDTYFEPMRFLQAYNRERGMKATKADIHKALRDVVKIHRKPIYGDEYEIWSVPTFTNTKSEDDAEQF